MSFRRLGLRDRGGFQPEVLNHPNRVSTLAVPRTVCGGPHARRAVARPVGGRSESLRHAAGTETSRMVSGAVSRSDVRTPPAAAEATARVPFTV